MPHQCVRCSALYDDGAQEILQGCSKCSAKVFFYIRKDHLKKTQEQVEKLSPKDKEQIEKDVKEMVGSTEQDAPVILDLESIRVKKPGKFEIDLVKLFKDVPLIYKLADGKYMIDLPKTFKKGLDKFEEDKK